MKKITFLFLVITLGLFLWFFIIPGSAIEGVTKKKEKVVFKFFFEGTVHSTDPLDASDIYTTRLVNSLYDRLYEYKYLERPYKLFPSLARDFPQISDDFLTYTVSLKAGIFFRDDPCFPNGKGREIVAEDFIYSAKRHFDKNNISTSSGLWKKKIVGLDDWEGFEGNKEIVGLKALDKRTIQIRLREPFPQFLHTLALPFLSLVPKEAVDFYKKDFPRKPVGSGAWSLKHLSNKKIVLEKNPNYRREVITADNLSSQKSKLFNEFKALEGKTLPLCDEIEIISFSNPHIAWLSFLKKGELNYLRLPREMPSFSLEDEASGKLIKTYKNKYSVYHEISSEMQFFGFNMGDSSFGYSSDPVQNERNKGLRKAIRYAFNWPKFIKRRFSNRGTLFPGVGSSAFEASPPSLSRDSITYNPEKAKSLLKKYNWNKDNLPVFIFTGISGVISQQNFDLFRSFFIKIGYPEEKIKSHFYLTFQEMFGALKKARHPSFGYITWHMDIPDVFDFFHLFYSGNKTPGMNLFNYDSKKFDKLFYKISRMSSGFERNKLIKEAIEVIIDDCPIVSGFSPYNTHMWDKEFLLFPSTRTNYLKYVALKSQL